MDFAVRQSRLSDAPNGTPRPVSQRIDKRLGRAGDSGTRRRFRAERGRRAARREVGLVSSNGQSGLPHGKSGPAPCHTVRQPIDAFPCRSLRRSRRASRQSSATLSVSASGLMVARSSRLGHSGSRLPGHRYESSRHGLAASRPRTPGSGASAVTPPPTKPSSRFGTRHIVRCNAVVRSAPLPVRHPGPRVTAAGRCTPAPSGPATTASQSGQRHASYHPPRPIMSAARDRMLSIPCRARLRAARHYRIAPPGDMPRKAPSAASGRRIGSDGRCASRRPPDERHHGADRRLVGAGRLHAGSARVRCPQDAPAVHDSHLPHQRRAVGTVRPRRLDVAVDRRLVGIDVHEAARRRERRQRVVAAALDERLWAEHRTRPLPVPSTGRPAASCAVALSRTPWPANGSTGRAGLAATAAGTTPSPPGPGPPRCNAWPRCRRTSSARPSHQ